MRLVVALLGVDKAVGEAVRDKEQVNAYAAGRGLLASASALAQPRGQRERERWLNKARSSQRVVDRSIMLRAADPAHGRALAVTAHHFDPKRAAVSGLLHMGLENVDASVDLRASHVTVTSPSTPLGSVYGGCGGSMGSPLGGSLHGSVHEASVQSGSVDQYPDFDALMAMGAADSPVRAAHARPHSSTFTGVGPGVTTVAPGSSFRALASRGGPSSPFRNDDGVGGGSFLSRSNPMASATGGGGAAHTSPSMRRLYGQSPFVPGMSAASMSEASFADRPGTAGAIMSTSLDGGHSTATAQQQQQQQGLLSSYRLDKTIKSLLHEHEVVLSRADAKNAARDKVRRAMSSTSTPARATSHPHTTPNTHPPTLSASHPAPIQVICRSPSRDQMAQRRAMGKELFKKNTCSMEDAHA